MQVAMEGPRSAAMAISNKPRVLVVDDDPLVLRMLARMLGPGFQVQVACSTAEATSMLAATEFVAVISDYEMPGGRDGLYLLALVREVQPWARRVLHTGFSPPSIRLRSESCVVEHLVCKPALAGELLAVLQQPHSPCVR